MAAAILTSFWVSLFAFALNDGPNAGTWKGPWTGLNTASLGDTGLGVL